jgi:hypothetical protein
MPSRRLASLAAAAALFASTTRARADPPPPAPSNAPPPPQGYTPQPGYPARSSMPQGYPPPPGYAPQGYAPQGYAPQGYTPQGYAPPQGYPGYPPPQVYSPSYTAMRRRSPTMIAVGSALISVGATALIAGPAFYAGATQSVVCNFGEGGGCAPTTDGGAQGAGIFFMVLGIAAVGAGIPLLVVGAQKVPDRGEAASLLPTVRATVRAGARGVTMAWDF